MKFLGSREPSSLKLPNMISWVKFDLLGSPQGGTNCDVLVMGNNCGEVVTYRCW